MSQKRKDTKNVLERVVSEKSDLSTRVAPQVADISRELARMVLKEDLGLKPYKLPEYHELIYSWFKTLPKNTSK